MATTRKTTKKTAGRRSAGRARSGAAADAAAAPRSLSDTAQQIWLAGVGAFGRAQAEGAKLFEALVKEGLSLEKTARGFAGGRADFVRDAVENHVGQARERATDTWDKLEKVFEARVQKALVKLGVPGREDLADLARRVEGLTAELRRQQAPKAAAKRAPAKAAKKSAPRKAGKRAKKSAA